MSSPHAEEWREFGVFPAVIDPSDGAADETNLLCSLGYWTP